jgi:hypothetical protein
MKRNPEKASRSLRWKGTAIATGALSLMGTLHANMSQAEHSHDGIVDVGLQHVLPSVDALSLPGLKVDLSADYGTRVTLAKGALETIPGTNKPTMDITPEKPSHLLPLAPLEFSMPTAAEIVKTTVLKNSEVAIDPIYEKWARQFSEDSEAGKTVREGVVQDAINSIVSMQNDHTRVVQVVCEGTASDEDNYSDTHPGTTNPGFGIPSPENVLLATKRGATVVDQIAGPLTKALGNIPVINKIGREVVNPTLADQITWIAGAKGINPVDLVKQFNRGDYSNLTSQDLVYFQGLRDDRFVQCWVTLEVRETAITVIPGKPGIPIQRPEPLPQGQPVSINHTEIRIPSTHEIIGEVDDTNTDKKLRVILVLIPVPVIRRKKLLGSIEPENVTEPPDDETLAPIFIPPTSRTTPRKPRSSGIPPTIFVDPPPPLLQEVRQHIRPIRAPRTIGDESAGYNRALERRKQPRNHNNHKDTRANGGRMPRNKGGNRGTVR